jgi:hypothetical protein
MHGKDLSATGLLVRDAGILTVESIRHVTWTRHLKVERGAGDDTTLVSTALWFLDQDVSLASLDTGTNTGVSHPRRIRP